VPNYVSCLRDDIDDRCGEDALRIWLESVKNMGCERGLGKIPKKRELVADDVHLEIAAETSTKAPRSVATRPSTKAAPSARPTTKTTTTRQSTTTTRGSTASSTIAAGTTGTIRTSTQRLVQVRPLIRNQVRF